MAKIEYKVCVVTVTYGDRWKFLEQVLARVLLFNSVTAVVIVNNASSYNLEARLDAGNNRLHLINTGENTGSAGGYKRGLEYAFGTDADFIWLLDDDNLPANNCLDVLLAKWDTTAGADNRKALFCMRQDRPVYAKIARGEDPARFYLVANNFLGFSVSRIFYNQLKKFTDRFKKARPLTEAKIPFAPYGGLLFHRSIINDIGLPREDFFVYVDDTEYTYRITENKGSIWLMPSCIITDIDKSQGITYKKRMFRSVLLDEWSFRMYYLIRNMVFFNKKAISNRFLFNINKYLCLAGLYFASILGAKRKEYEQLLIAVHDGLEGKLGKSFQIPEKK